MFTLKGRAYRIEESNDPVTGKLGRDDEGAQAFLCLPSPHGALHVGSLHLFFQYIDTMLQCGQFKCRRKHIGTELLEREHIRPRGERGDRGTEDGAAEEQFCSLAGCQREVTEHRTRA